MVLPLPSHFGHLRLASGSCRVRLPPRIQEFPAKFISALSRPFTFHVGVSWASKPADPKITRCHTPFPADSCIGRWRDTMLALREKNISRDAGEDFFYITQMHNASGVAFGVADGVGGWIDSGVDPSLFAQSLMYHAHRHSRDAWAGEPEIDPTQDQPERAGEDGREITPHQCLDLAYHSVLQDRLVEAGSSTACLVSLNAASGVLRAANLGDSGFLIIRSSSVIHKQPTQTHFFNCPLQLTKLPLSTNTNMHYIDLPDAAAEYETKLRDGDIVVAYTDGLSDNVFPADIVAICSLVARSVHAEGEQVQAMADAIVRYAQTCMRDRKRVSPFEREASREGMLFRGGKIDDVTVVTALVRETP
ncbi:phosphatase 2C-like domain-containing protein [Pisolithus thermaeus]|nr:phosphatase 2C-like domain-containing protein [Pisolithus croceorrhizus]KAI6167029.1 phosphatase 2C-like domain-containing protein [Pisolithus thermaeus]